MNHPSWAIILFCSVLLALPLTGLAQETDPDTTEVELGEDETERRIILNQQFDRPMSGGSLTEMGTYDVPRENQFYQRPFKGQKYLDMAVEAYREQLKNQVGNNWYWQFLKAVSPYIRLELGAFQTMEMQYVDRDNPLFRSYRDPEKKQ